MGTWGPHSFDNDDANDWCQAFREMGLFVAKSTMEVALGDSRGGGISADVASRAIAAVEAVSFAVGRGSREAKKAFAGAPEVNASEAEELVPTAVEVIDSVLTGSQLNTLWAEAGSDQHAAWVASMTALKRRVEGAPEAPVAETAAPTAAPAARSSPAAGADVAALHAAIDQLALELQVVRKEMREGMIELARQIAGRSG